MRAASCRSALAPLVLAACASLDPVTVARLAMLDPLTADPGGFEVALTLPEGVDLPAGGAALTLRGTRGAEVSDGSYPLEQPGGAALWRIAPEGLADLRAQQATIAAWEAADPAGTTGSLSVRLSPCRVGAGPLPGAVVDVSLRTEPGGPLLPLVRGGPLSAVVDAASVAQLPACDGAR